MYSSYLTIPVLFSALVSCLEFDVESVHCEPASAFDAYARFRGTDSMLVYPLSQLVLYAFECIPLLFVYESSRTVTRN